MRQLLAVFSLAMLCFCPGLLAQSEPIKIGLPAGLSGDLASYGKSVRDGALLGVDVVNGKGGVLNGRKIELVVEDNLSKPEQAKTVFEKLIKRDKVVAILGDVTSGCTLAGAPVAQEARIPVLSPTATAEKVTQIGDYVFRCCYIDSTQGQAAARFTLEDLKAKNIAILYNVKDPYSTDLRDAFVAYVKAHGGNVTADLSYSSGDVDFKGQLTRIRSSHPDVIYAPGYYSEIGLICQQARRLGLKEPLVGSDGWDSAKTAEIGGDAVNGCYFTNHYSTEDPRPEAQEFVAAYKSKYHTTPDALAVLAYDAARILADAIDRAGSTAPGKIRDALAATRDFPGAAGATSFTAERNARKPICIIKIENRQFHLQKSMEME